MIPMYDLEKIFKKEDELKEHLEKKNKSKKKTRNTKNRSKKKQAKAPSRVFVFLFI